MYATEILRNEHEGIKIAISVLDRMADEIEAGRTVDLDDVDKLLDFLRTFVDRCHHGKEEDLLFPALEAAGIPREMGPIGVMLSEHSHGRAHIRNMVDALAGLREGDPEAPKAFAAAAHGYVRILTGHINKENNILFAMAEHQLLPHKHEELAKGFDQIEHERIGPGVHEQYHALLDRLSREYLGGER